MVAKAFRQRHIAGFAVVALLVAGGAVCAPAHSQSDATHPVPGRTPADVVPWNEEFAYLVGMQAYIYGYPAIRYATLRYQLLHLGDASTRVAINRFHHTRQPADPRLQFGGSPNRETPYSMAVLDLGPEPVVVTVPENREERYYSLQFTDFYSDTVGYIGLRATQNMPGDYLIAGPDWQGQAPKGVRGVIRSWTPWTFVFGRTYADPTEQDLAAMRTFQDGFRLTPLSAYGRPVAPVPTRRDVLQPAPGSDPLGAFKTMNAAMRENPPSERDAALMRQFALVGLGPLATVDIESLDPAIKRGLARAIVDGDALLAKVARAGGSITNATTVRNNWFYGPRNWGRMGAEGDFLGRAGTQVYSGIVEHLVEESVKLRTFLDADGQPLNGTHRYELHFRKDEIPEAHSFWSVTLYDERYNLFFNEAGRYSVGDKVPALEHGADGSLTIYIQPDPPGEEKAGNWLPSPRGRDFNLFMRTYLPGKALLEQTYVVPPVRRVPLAGVAEDTT